MRRTTKNILIPSRPADINNQTAEEETSRLCDRLEALLGDPNPSRVKTLETEEL